MSRRSILLVSAMCVGLASIAAVAPASAHGGGLGAAGSFHSAGLAVMRDPEPASSHSHKGRPVAPGALVAKPAIPSVAFPPPNPPANSPIGPAPTHTGPVGPGAIVKKPGLPAVAFWGVRRW